MLRPGITKGTWCFSPGLIGEIDQEAGGGACGSAPCSPAWLPPAASGEEQLLHEESAGGGVAGLCCGFWAETSRLQRTLQGGSRGLSARLPQTFFPPGVPLVLWKVSYFLHLCALSVSVCCNTDSSLATEIARSFTHEFLSRRLFRSWSCLEACMVCAKCQVCCGCSILKPFPPK